ncbi:MAG: tRNA (guanosine(37)-N1)-methyltransferase TrmD [Firmicutes bacterium]|nr:tRNA (guanosine(37)-N1)-methyltransferase TrmD [Bacillota bacterium]
MRIDILTLFPGMFVALRESITGRAAAAGHVQIVVTDLRDFACNKHRSVDDYPYGGGPGMILQPEPFFLAVEQLRREDARRGRVILLTPQGSLFTQETARRLAREDRLILLCGHYVGVDERVGEALVDEEISLGDFILTGGEIPAMAVTDAVVRLLPGVLPAESVADESFTGHLLEYPQYTRPAEFRGMAVPEVLLSGNHAEIAKWRRRQSLLRTLLRRPELLQQADLSEEEKSFLRREAENRKLNVVGLSNILDTVQF